MLVTVRVLVSLLVLVGAARCGDPMYVMRIQNASGQTVTVYELGAYPTGDRGYTLAPGEIKTTTWFRPRDDSNEQRATVKAIAADGSVVFCRRITYSEAKGNFQWTVRITAGPVDCS
jgi:limonene-1,2-epoxide hydrolase